MIKSPSLERKVIQTSNIVQLNSKINRDLSALNLTKREREVLNRVILGYTAKEIGKYLHISFRTVEAHINTLKIKLGCNYKRELINSVMTAGLISKINLGND